MNDNIIPFRPRSPGPANPAPYRPTAETRRVNEPREGRYGEAHDIQRELSRRFGFDVMLPGMPADADVLFATVGRLRAGLAAAAGKLGEVALRSLRGVHVFFSCEKNEIVDDHGYRSLRLTKNFSASDVERLVTLMIRNKSPQH